MKFSSKNAKSFEEHRKTLTIEQYAELALEFYGNKVERLTADVAQNEKQLKKMKQELKQSEAAIEVFEKLKNGGAMV